MNIASAAPGTTLRRWDADGNTTDIPIVAWTHVQGNMAHPIFPVPGISVGPNTAIFFFESLADDNGLWLHPASGQTVDTADEIEAIVIEALGSIDLEGKPDTRPIHFGAQTYKSKSFWHWPTANAIFTVEGEEVYPSDARVIKVKREEWAKLKRDGAVVINPHDGLITEEAEVDAGEEEEEDDYRSLI